jgi:membrane associated rhomboid family serine protease
MGIYDRDYYRRDGSGFMAFTDRGQMCKWLIGVNVVVFILQILSGSVGEDEFGRPVREVGNLTRLLWLDPDAVLHGQVWRLLTYAFLHDPSQIMHILFNMLFLWWFGSDMEDMLGPKEFLAFYLVAALCGGVVFTVSGLISGHAGVCLGASGAVTAVLVLCACHYPHRVILLFFILPVPIWLFVIFEVAQDAYTLLRNISTPVAVGVHLAGAAFGFAYFKRHWRLMNLQSSWQNWRRQRQRPRLRVFKEETPVEPATLDVDEQLEAKLDAVLDKVARHGREGLSEEEKAILLRASEIYRRRRT